MRLNSFKSLIFNINMIIFALLIAEIEKEKAQPLEKKKPTKSNCPIGIFDSGLGGISVVNEVAKLLPAESIIYFGDSANCPYGEKSIDEVIWLSEKITEFLISRNCKLIITACNTATGLAIRHLRKKYDLPFIGIEPAVKPAAKASKTGHIGVLATSNTFRSDHFINTRSQHANHVKVHGQPGIGLAEAVENNLIEAGSTEALLTKYLQPMISENIDALVLGCTHYPFLEKKIRGMLPDGVKMYNPAPAIAARTQHVLAADNLLTEEKSGRYQFFTSGDVQVMRSFIRKNFTGYKPGETKVTNNPIAPASST